MLMGCRICCNTYYVGRSRQLLDDNATVGTCLAILVVGKPRAEALDLVSCLVLDGSHGTAHCVAVCVPAGYRIRLVEQPVTYLAREMRAQAVKVGLERLELLQGVSWPSGEALR
jgi:hypothetical protein